MIIKNNKELIARYYGSKVIAYVYQGAKLIWGAINSCFGSGLWLNDKIWKNDDTWKNN